MIFLLILAALVNLVAALGPEVGFDALWYHLTIPKLYLAWQDIRFVPGGLLYYSAMPKLGELLYLGNDTLAHFVNWGAGIGAAFLTYKLARKSGLSSFYALLSSLIFYASPLVGWQSGSAYVDLLRTFFEALALYWLLSNKKILSGVALGLAISTKTLALGSLGILGILGKFSWKLILPAVLIAAPWFIWAYLKTGYPFYPLGAGILDLTHRFGNFWPPFPLDWSLLIYLVTLPFWPRKSPLFKYAVLAYLVWFITPRTGETRFLLPYLPAFAVLAAGAIAKKKVLIIVALAIAILTIFYRGAANARLLPYLLGRETREQYLCRRLDFATRVFVDCDGWFGKNIQKTDLVLVSGYHNLYYVNFPFVHETWYKGEAVNYLLAYKDSSSAGKLVYQNNLTGARLYKL